MFNWDLDVDLLALLPPWYREVLDYQQICNAESEQLQYLSNDIVQIDNNFYFQTMDESSVSRWEEIFEILPDTQTETLEFRRERLLIRIKTMPPFTLAFLLQKLDELIGLGKWKIDIDYTNYTINIELDYDRLHEPGALLREIMVFLGAIKPAHMRLWPAMTAAPVVFQTIEHFQPIILQMPFYFSNQPNDITLLNGRRSLDGSWKLDSTFRGVVMRSFELYMAWQERQKIERGALLVPGIVLPNRERSVWSGLSWHDRLTNRIGAGSKSLGLKSNFDGRQTSAMAGGSLTKDTMWRLDGSARLDGSKKLNAAIIKEMI